MNGTPTTVLLAGDTASRSASLRRWLGQRGCHCTSGYARKHGERIRTLSAREPSCVRLRSRCGAYSLSRCR